MDLMGFSSFGLKLCSLTFEPGLFSSLIATYLGERNPDVNDKLLNLVWFTLLLEIDAGVKLVATVF